jgi:hypothetical protein
VDDDRPRYDTPTGEPCPRVVCVDGSVVGSGSCLGCGVCMLFAGLLDDEAPERTPDLAG